MNDLIHRNEAIKALQEDAEWLASQGSDWQDERMERDISILQELPVAHPEVAVMNDLIDRQAAIELIHTLYPSAPFIWMNKKLWAEKYKPYIECEKALERLPSAQPEIIRCKDCKYCEHWYKDKGRCFLWYEDGIDVFEDGFCNYAERIE